MKVLFITHYSELLGANLSFLSLIRYLRSDYNCEPVVLLPQDGPICDILEEEHVEYYVQPFYWWIMKSNCYDFKHFLDNLNKQRRNYFRLRHFAKSVLEGKHFDLIYSNSVTINVGVILARYFHINHIWHFREDLSQFGFVIPPITGYLSFHHKATKRFVMISDFQLKGYEKYIPAKKCIRIYDGVNLSSNYSSCVTKIGFKNSLIKICCVGAISEQKNQKDIVEAIPLLKSKGYNVQLHLVGPEDDDYKKRLLSEIQEMGIDSDVLFYGQRQDVFEILAQMDIAIMPSKDEAFGRVTIEYMLMGIPVVASNSGANPELVKDGRNGYLYELYNPRSLADSVGKIIDKNEESISMIRMNNREDALRFSENANASSIFNEFVAVQSMKY